MSLTVTVQKGHDFSSGNITRATLNAGAVPTVAVTGAVGTTELVDGAITDAKVGTTAGILLSKLSGQTADDILVVSATAGNPTGTKEIKALPGYLSGAIKEVSNEVEITPSDNTIIADKLIINTDENLVFGLANTLSDVEVDDYVIIHDSSAVDESVRLKKAKISSIQKVGTTEYAMEAISKTETGDDFNIEIDLDGSPFQTVTFSESAKYHDFYIKSGSQSSTTVKTVTVKIVCDTGGEPNEICEFGADGEADNSRWPAWKWLETVSNAGPTDIFNNKTAILSVTSFGSGDADVVAAYAVQNMGNV